MKALNKYKFICALSAFAVLLLTAPYLAMGQQAQESFGKNRVQYIPYDWKMIGSKNYEIYFYEGGEQTAKMAAKIAEGDFRRITNLIGYFPYAKIRIYIYNNELEKLQSNIGFNPEDQMTGGETQFLKSEVEIAFNGNYQAFRDELIYKISKLMITDMMYGGSFKEVVQSTYFLNLPDWFINGAASYVTYGWDEQMDDHMRDAVLSKGVRRPSRLIGTDAELAGQSIWNFIAVRYGETSISNVLNLTRIIRDEESSITNTLAVSFRTFIRDWRNYYLYMANLMAESERYVEDDQLLQRNNGKRDISMMRMSKDGKYLAYVQEKDGRFQIKLTDLVKNRTSTVERGGVRIRIGDDRPPLPVIAWDSDNRLHFIKNIRNKLHEFTYDPDVKKIQDRRPLPDFDGIHSFSFAPKGGQAIYSGIEGGQSDLYLYDGRQFNRITNDIYSDIEPTFDINGENIYFSSDRKRDTAVLAPDLSTISGDFDIFSVPAERGISIPVRTYSSPYNELRPIFNDSNELIFLSDRSGISNLYRLESGEPVPFTNYQQSLRKYDYDPGTGMLTYMAVSDQKERIFKKQNLDARKEVNINRTPRQEYIDSRRGYVPSVSTRSERLKERSEETETKNKADEPVVLDEGEIDFMNYQFESDKPTQRPKEAEEPESVVIINPKRGPLAKGLTRDGTELTAVADARTRMGIYNTTTSFVINPINGFGINLATGLSDMLGNHRVNANAIFFGDLNSTIYDAEYLYLKERLDYGLRYYRRTIYTSEENVLQRYELNRYEMTVSYPLSTSARFSISPVHMHTRYTLVLPLDSLPDPQSDYLGLKAAFIYDNTVTRGMNMNEGTKFKISYEYNRGVSAQQNSFGKINFDLRHYQPIHRELVFAVRMAYGQFLGPSKKNFLLGGMDNWLFNNRAPEGDPLAMQNQSIDNRDLLFMEYVTNLRGFNYNALVGNSYALMNAEVRLPIIKYLSNRPVGSGFFENLQLVGFTDIGTAWSGISPFNEKNSFNTRTITDQSFEATVYNYKNPFLVGYGGGVRTLLFGFYFKFDVAWGIEDYSVNDPKFYLTLGYDF